MHEYYVCIVNVAVHWKYIYMIWKLPNEGETCSQKWHIFYVICKQLCTSIGCVKIMWVKHVAKNGSYFMWYVNIYVQVLVV